MGHITLSSGDLLSSGAQLIIHQTNCKGVMGSGIARSIRIKYPEVFPPYHRLCLEKGSSLLGKALFIKTDSGIIIANCFGQNDYGTQSRQTDYQALEHALECAANYAADADLTVVGLPYKIGCARGGGDWNIVYSIIERVFFYYDGETQIWKF